MKIKEEIDNLKDIRRNLLIVVIGIVGGLCASFMNASAVVFNLLTGLKALLALIGSALVFYIMDEITFCNERINKLIEEMKE